VEGKKENFLGRRKKFRKKNEGQQKGAIGEGKNPQEGTYAIDIRVRKGQGKKMTEGKKQEQKRGPGEKPPKKGKDKKRELRENRGRL